MDIKILRHSAAHVLAQAVKRLFPDVKLGIGPVIEDGFYYDFDRKTPFTPDDLKKIEAEMQKIIKENNKFQKIKEPKDFFKNEPFKKDLYQDLKKDKQKATFYQDGDFIDLCKGPHINSTSEIKAFKLVKVAGAYWKGDQSKQQLQRIYGVAFKTKEELNDYLRILEEAEKRNHIKLGKQLDLFSIHLEGHGFIFWHNNGMILRNELINYWREEHRNAGYIEVSTPILLSKTLWETSGHWKLYKDNIYTTKIDEKDFAIKPMNCPGGMLIYKTKLHSYKELPLRVAELGLVHRHELSGVLNGLFRVRAFTQDDAHIFCTEEQLESEIINVIKLIQKMLKTCGFKNYRYALSVRDPKNKEKYLGTDNGWKSAENALASSLKKLKLDFEIKEGEAKFYGPSLDILIEDSLKREWQCGTIQLDFNMPERFDITYEGKDGKKHRPFMLHRVVYGSFERFIGVLLEHYAGNLPFWLSPLQVIVMTVTDRNKKFANEIVEELKKYNFRVELDDKPESIGKKVREAQLKKANYSITIGDKETKNNTLAVRTRKGNVTFGVKLPKFIKDLEEERSKRAY